MCTTTRPMPERRLIPTQSKRTTSNSKAQNTKIKLESKEGVEGKFNKIEDGERHHQAMETEQSRTR
ncbi:hypothetical protein DPMN_078850 [Dreissena polymorpha]|uniref:Uncharacterized protein n=1 Tax=Dreissena polymorpha TaxID=45954 RepID=A0A9D4BQM1_DREPO|nr:hypothetical protein DPMN_078850 [Dreissena polymorpha]